MGAPRPRERSVRRGWAAAAPILSAVALSAWAAGAAGADPRRAAEPIVALPRPRHDGTTSVEAALRARRSARDFAVKALSLGELGQLLWAAQGVTGPAGLRTAPSAGALHPLELHVVVGDVVGLEPGLHAYLPATHSLRRLSDGDHRAALAAAALGNAAVRDAPASLVISGVFERTTATYGERGVRYVHMEAGHAAENVYLQAVALGLGTVAIGAFEDRAVARATGLPPPCRPLYLMPVGTPRQR